MALIHYDLELVISSIITAFVLCYLATLSIHQLRVRSRQNKHHKMFLILSGFLLGLAIWVSFFLVILAADIPNTFHFDYGLALVSFLISFIASTFAIWTTVLSQLNLTRLILGSILMGLGIAGMHYVGIMGLLIDNHIVIYQPKIMIVAVLLAVCAIYRGIFCIFLSGSSKIAPGNERLRRLEMTFATVVGSKVMFAEEEIWHLGKKQ